MVLAKVTCIKSNIFSSLYTFSKNPRLLCNAEASPDWYLPDLAGFPLDKVPKVSPEKTIAMWRVTALTPRNDVITVTKGHGSLAVGFVVDALHPIQ